MNVKTLSRLSRALGFRKFTNCVVIIGLIALIKPALAEEELSSEHKQIIKSQFFQSFPSFKLGKNNELEAPLNKENELLIFSYLRNSKDTVQNMLQKLMILPDEPKTKFNYKEISDFVQVVRMDMVQYELQERNSPLNSDSLPFLIQKEFVLGQHQKQLSIAQKIAFVAVPLSSFLAYTMISPDFLYAGILSEALAVFYWNQKRRQLRQIEFGFELRHKEKLKASRFKYEHLNAFLNEVEKLVEESGQVNRCNTVFF